MERSYELPLGTITTHPEDLVEVAVSAARRPGGGHSSAPRLCSHGRRPRSRKGGNAHQMPPASGGNIHISGGAGCTGDSDEEIVLDYLHIGYASNFNLRQTVLQVTLRK